MSNQDETELIHLANKELDRVEDERRKLDAQNTKLIMENSKLKKQLREANSIIKMYSRDELNDIFEGERIASAEDFEWQDELPSKPTPNIAKEYLLKWRIK